MSRQIPVITTPFPLAELERQYRAYLGPRSLGTLGGLKRVFEVAGKVGAGLASDLTPSFLDDLVKAMKKGEKLGPKTIQTYLYIFKGACRFAVKQGYLVTSPFESAPNVGAIMRIEHRSLKRNCVCTPVQFAAILEYLKERSRQSFMDHRLYALISVITYVEIFHYDAARLLVADVDIARKVLRIPLLRRRKKETFYAPMPEPLVEVLTEWLAAPFTSTKKRRAIGPDDVRELRRLKSEGATEREIQEHLGITRSVLRSVVRGQSYRDVAEDGSPSKRVSDCLYLFPSIRSKGEDPWTQLNTMSAGSPVSALNAAAKAVGMKDLTFADFRYFRQRIVIPAFAAANPTLVFPRDEVSPAPSAPVAEMGPDAAEATNDLADFGHPVPTPAAGRDVIPPEVRVRPGPAIVIGPDGHPWVRGNLHRLRTPQQRSLVSALVGAGREGMHLPELQKICPSAAGVLRWLRKSDKTLGHRIYLAKKRGGVYWIDIY